MKIIFRTDASVQMGSGHVMRCLTLAEELREQGASVEFVCREHPGNLIKWIQEQRGFVAHKLPIENPKHSSVPNLHNALLGASWEQDADSIAYILKKKQELINLLIVDHYALDIRWEQTLKPLVEKIFVIDDLANRHHDCSFLLDQNFYIREHRYQGLLNDQCRQLLGPKYALLRKEFVFARKKLRQRTGDIKRVLVFFGGSDPTNETERALSALQTIDNLDLEIDVVIGTSNYNREILQKKLNSMQQTKLHIQVSNIAELIAKADIGIGAGGSTHWERCCLGLPSIITTIAENQIEVTSALAEKGLIQYLGAVSEIECYDYQSAILKLSDLPTYLSMVRKSMEMVDGQGISRLIRIIMEGR